MSMFDYIRYFVGWGTSPVQSPHVDLKQNIRSTPEPFEPPPLDMDAPLPILPPEIVELIVINAARPLLPPDHAPYCEYLRTRKNHWKRLGGVVSSTKYYRQLLVKKWFAVVVLHEPSDWDRLLSPSWMGGLESVICTVLAAKGALTSSPRNRTNTNVLTSFSRLSRISLDYHNDFLRSGANYPYYQLVTELPRSLEVLEILNAHGPDEHIIRLASRCCPDLTELRLGRCTMFNNRNCVWWKAHPADHDAYMADRGVEAYAAAVGQLIDNMPKLRVLHIGVYLTPIEAVWAHRVDHRKLHPVPDVMRHESPEGIHNHLHHVALAAANGEDPEPPVNYHYPPLAKQEIWDAPCSECDKHFKVPAENAELRTACVLSARVWSLRTISFASFTSPGRVGISSWEVRPRHSALGTLLDAEDALVMHPQLEQENPPIRHIKIDAGRLEDGEFVKQKHLVFGISSFGGEILLSPPINEPLMETIF
ncbi:unnamed protein product [Rhizoctonia solani]|uniref:Uncharacterized protein n=2 Tax=Rhizoctonia solani TaxID=456999 RepID=A0A8H3AL72_9AGAM|nr:hypothetical protein V565_051140 [Rhizoctonia solani 123E]CAE6427000.1 unnamed protein product [Rhizoctonia solani]CAE6493994.1 unnamed protein product [Rhizoctonia solani]